LQFEIDSDVAEMRWDDIAGAYGQDVVAMFYGSIYTMMILLLIFFFFENILPKDVIWLNVDIGIFLAILYSYVLLYIYWNIDVESWGLIM